MTVFVYKYFEFLRRLTIAVIFLMRSSFLNRALHTYVCILFNSAYGTPRLLAFNKIYSSFFSSLSKLFPYALAVQQLNLLPPPITSACLVWCSRKIFRVERKPVIHSRFLFLCLLAIFMPLNHNFEATNIV